MAGGVVLTENSDYTVDYSMGIVTSTNQSIIDSGTNVSCYLEKISPCFHAAKEALPDWTLNIGLTRTLPGEPFFTSPKKSLTEKVNIGDEVINNTMGT